MRKSVLAAGIAAAGVTAFAASPTMRPGLYDYTMKIEIPGMPFAMPPVTTQQCLTQADIEKGSAYQAEQNKECEVRNLKQTATTLRYDMACKDGSTGSGDFTFTADSMQGKILATREGTTSTTNMTARRTGDCKK